MGTNILCKTYLLFTLALLAVASHKGAYAQVQPAQVLTQTQVTDDFDNAYLGILAYHPKISTSQDSSKIKAVYSRLRATISGKTSTQELSTLVGTLLSAIEDGHTGMIDADALRKGNVYLPFTTSFIEGKYVITESSTDEVPVGSVLVSIDGIAADSVYKETLLYQGSGDNRSLVDDKKIRNCGHMSYRFRTRGYNKNSSMVRILNTTYEEDVRVQVRTALWHSMLGGEGDKKLTSGVIVDSIFKVGLLTVPSFIESNQGESMREAISNLRKAKYVIVDLRNNPGGYIARSSQLLSYLISQDVTTLKNARIKTAAKDIISNSMLGLGAKGSLGKVLRKSKQKWINIVDELEDEDSEAILGRVDSVKDNIAHKEIVVLVNENTYSAGAITAMALKAKGRKLIGQHPSNDNCRINALYIEELELEHSGIVIMMPVIAAEFNRQDCTAGNMQVDYVVTPTIEAVRAGKDTVLNFAVNYMRQLAVAQKDTIGEDKATPEQKQAQPAQPVLGKMDKVVPAKKKTPPPPPPPLVPQNTKGTPRRIVEIQRK